MRKSKFNRPLTIALDDRLFEYIKTESDREETSYAGWIRKVLYDFVDNKEARPEMEESKLKNLSQSRSNRRKL
jgi:hypothetical protein